MSRGRGGTDKDKAKMSMHNFSGQGDGECVTCGLPKRNTVHINPERPHPPGEGYTKQQADERHDNA